MALNVPKGLQSGLKWIASAPDDRYDRLYSALSRIEPRIFTQSSIGSLYTDSIRDALSEADFKAVFEALLGFHNGQLTAGISREKFLSGLLESDFVVSMSETERQALVLRLPRLVALEPIYVSARALDVLFDTPGHFVAGRILTDVRPLFSESGDVEIKCALLSQILKIDYHDTEGRKRVYISVDMDDIDKLQTALERAKAKITSTKRLLSQANVSVIEIEREV